MHGHPVIGEDSFEEQADPGIVRRQQRLAGDQGYLDRVALQSGQAVLCRKRELDPAGAAADNGEAKPRHFSRARQQRLPACREPVDRLDRDRVLGGTGDIVRAGGRADIDRQNIVSDRRMGIAQQCAIGPVEPDRFVPDQPRAGKSREPAEIDVAFVERIVPGDVARQHARIGRLHVAGNERHAHPGHRPHAEALQHMHVRMAAADENEILGNRDTLLHRRNYAQVPSATPVVRRKRCR